MNFGEKENPPSDSWCLVKLDSTLKTKPKAITPEVGFPGRNFWQLYTDRQGYCSSLVQCRDLFVLIFH